MKTAKYFAIFFALLLSISSCSKGDDDKGDGDKQETLSKDEKPNWKSSASSSDYEYSATYILSVVVSGTQKSFKSNDELALFVNDTCRATAEFSEDNSKAYLLLPGDDKEAKVTVKYYSSTDQHIYSLENGLSYTANGVVGVEDEPKSVEFTK